MRSVPHRVVCLVGLDDGAFPRGGAPDGDDLLVADRHLGDHDRRAEDRQLLLDAVLAASDALIVTYNGRDARTNEAMPPAVPVNELLDVLDATMHMPDGANARTTVVHQHPLQPSDRRNFEAGALGTGGPWSFDPHLLAGARAATTAPRSAGPFLPEALEAHLDDVVEVSALIDMTLHPVRAFLRQRLGLSLRVYDDRPSDALQVDLDNLALWAVGDRLLTALIAGNDPDAVAAAEMARGLLPPGDLGRQGLAKVRKQAEAIAADARLVADGPRSSLDVDVAVAGDRRLVGTVADVIGDTIRPVTYSTLGAKPRLRAWVGHLAASLAHPDRALTTVIVGKRGRNVVRFGLGPIDVATAHARLDDLVALRDEAMCRPLPLYCGTSHAYVLATRDDQGPDPAEKAGKEWTSGFGWPREDQDPEHVLVLGEQRTVAQVLADPEFAALAHRLWDPLLDHAAGWSR